MKYVLSIDWLAVHCYFVNPDDSVSDKDGESRRLWKPQDGDDAGLFGRYPFRYKLAQFGTRQFSRLHYVSMPNEEGGWDDFAEVQSAPYSNILKTNSVIVRFVNRVLYRPDFWELAGRFLLENNFVFEGISRIDVCADFNDFATISPKALIEGFAAKKFRHVGRGNGALYFTHGIGAERDEHDHPVKDYGVRYTGLSFGTHSSDAHVYLYDKSEELRTQVDKPWIRDTWTAAGLDVRHVWRLEVSIKSKGCKFKDRASGEQVTIDLDAAGQGSELCKIYHTFVRKMFSFVHNRKGITNISREPRIELFDKDAVVYERAVLRNVSAGNRVQRMIIKALYLSGNLYRGAENIEMADLAQQFAINIAESTDLSRWMSEKVNEWDEPTHL